MQHAQPIQSYTRYVIALGLVAFLVYAFFPWATMRGTLVRFNSPDETANFAFATRVATSVRLSIAEPLNASVAPVVHPRATVPSDEGTILPGSFLGLPLLYGSVGLLFGTAVLPYLTAAVTALALYAGFAVWRRLVALPTAFLATVLLALHPALWYFASRPFYHNVLFVDLLIFAAWGYMRLRETAWHPEWLCSTVLMFAAAVLVRSVEVLWLLPLAVVTFWRDRHLLGVPQMTYVGSLLGSVGALVVLLFLLVYGSPLPSGYQIATDAASASLQGSLGTAVTSILFPFGFHPLTILANVALYGFLLFLPYWLLTAIGIRAAQRRGDLRDGSLRLYSVAAFAVTMWLFLYYGSWQIQDTVGTQVLTVGISYVRYWLPIYLVWLPFAAEGLIFVARRTGQPRLWLPVAVLTLAFLSFGQVYFEATEGLTATAGRLQQYRETAAAVNRLTPVHSVLIGDRSDKLFFPERRVISPGDRPFYTYGEVLGALPQLADVVPVYWYTATPPSRDAVAVLESVQLIMQQPIALPHGGWLYPVLHL